MISHFMRILNVVTSLLACSESPPSLFRLVKPKPLFFLVSGQFGFVALITVLPTACRVNIEPGPEWGYEPIPVLQTHRNSLINAPKLNFKGKIDSEFAHRDTCANYGPDKTPLDTIMLDTGTASVNPSRSVLKSITIVR